LDLKKSILEFYKNEINSKSKYLGGSKLFPDNYLEIEYNLDSHQ